MSERDDFRDATARVLDRQEVEGVLSSSFYASPRPVAPARAERGRDDKPTHYKVICISMYTQDLEELDAKVAELKRRGWTKANKSQLIRLALAALDLDKLPMPRQ